MRSRRGRLLAAGAVVLAAVVAGVLLLAGGDGSSSGSGERSGSAAAPPIPALESREDLRPPEIQVHETSDETAPGLMFLGPKKVFGARERPGEQQGPMIVDDQGRVRWWHPLEDGTEAYDVRVQRYEGRPVVTWWEGNAIRGSGRGVGMIYDTNYSKVAEVQTGTGADADIHEFLITPQGTALMILYRTGIPYDLSGIGGKKDAKIVEGIVQEIDIDTGEVLFEWRGLDHLDVSESYEKLDKLYGDSWDYLHLNSVDVAPDGDLLLSARHTWAVYKVDRETGEVVWRLGGKKSDFALEKDDRFSWQHDARAEGDGRVRIFDNAAASDPVRERSRVLTLDLDDGRERATRVAQLEHPEDLSSGTQANAQLLPGGHTVVGWGSRGYFSEYDEDGDLLFDARVERGFDSYRAFRSPWTGRPTDRPAIAVERSGDRATVRASWNGSTEVRRWQVVAGPSVTDLEPVGEPVAWDGLETEIQVSTGARYVAVQAVDADGRVLSTSAAEGEHAPPAEGR